MYEYARGIALARTWRVAETTVLTAALDERARTARSSAKPDDDAAKTIADMQATLSSELKAEVAFARGDIDAALAAERDAIKSEETMGGEPPLLASGRQLALGDLYMRAGRYADAEVTFRADLAKQPGSGWALRGLYIAVAAEKRDADARALRADWARAWQEADAPLKPAAGS